jgi:hypothetical protein
MPAIATASTNTGVQSQQSASASSPSPFGNVLAWMLGTIAGGLLLFGLVGGFLRYRQPRQQPAGAGFRALQEGETLPLSSLQPGGIHSPQSRQPTEEATFLSAAEAPGEQVDAAPTEIELEALMRQAQSGLSVLPGRSQSNSPQQE